MRLIQLVHVGVERRVCVVDGELLRFLAAHTSIYALANAALEAEQPLAAFADRLVTDETVDYDDVYTGRSPWSVLPAADHPDEPARCLISGTGLTHLGSAQARDDMHQQTQAETDKPVTDSMRMLWDILQVRWRHRRSQGLPSKELALSDLPASPESAVMPVATPRH